MPKKIDKNVIKRTLSYLKPYKAKLITVFICIVMGAIASVWSSMFLKTLIDEHIEPLLLLENPTYEKLLSALITMGIIFFVGVITTYISNRIMGVTAQSIIKDIRDEMFDKMQELPIKYFDDNSHGDILSRYTNDADTLNQLIAESLPRIISSVIAILASLVSMILLNAYLTLCVLVITFFIAFLSKTVALKSSKFFVGQQKSIGKVDGYIEEMINGSKVIKVFNHEEKAKKDFYEINDELRENMFKANKYANILMPLTGTLGNIEYVVIAFIDAIAAIKFNAGITIGTIASFLALVKSFNQPIGQVSSQLNSIIMALAGAERVFSLLDTAPEIDEGTVTLVNCKLENNELVETNEKTNKWAWKVPCNGINRYIELKGKVEINNVTFGYDSKDVLHDITLYAKPGQKIAFVGATGAGKTTITNLLNRFYDIKSGSILYDGIDVKDIKKADLRHSLGMVLQDTNLFTGTIKENIKYGKLDATDEEVIEACKIANADSFIRMLPQGYDTMLENNGSNLSQGQRQLLSIARAAISNPPVMILDEATSSIDTRTEKIVQDGMDKLMEGRTVFVIAHRLSTVRNAKAIMVLEHGKIIERGEHQTLIDQKGEYYQLYTGAFELE